MSENESKEKAPYVLEKEKFKIINILAILVAVVTYFATDIGIFKAFGLWLVALIAIALLYQLFDNRKE